MRPHSVTNPGGCEIFTEDVTMFVEADMKRLFFWLFVLALAALNWAALHDILIGEQDVWMEWTFVSASLFLFIAYVIRKTRESHEV